LTNFLEGIHGNGILLEEDTAYGDGDRDDPENLPGACNQQTNSYTFRVQGGLAVLDGVLYAFADGPGNSTDIVISTASTSKTGSPTALTSGQEALVVVYLSADDNAKHVYWEMGTAVTTASNTYPTTPSAFLNAPGSLTNRNTTVLATLRVVYSATGGDYNVSISEVNDKRAFVRPSPIYFSPVTSGAVAATTAATDPDAFHSGDEAGSLAGSRVGALWQSYNADGDSLLYYSAKTDSSTRHTHVLGPSSVKALTPSATTTFTYDESSIFVITPTSAHQFNPSGTFPKGHMVFVSNHAAHGTNGITFDNGGLGSVILGKESALFVYDGTNWKSVIFASGATSPNGHGANGAIQLSDGGGGFTSDTNLTWTASPATLTVNGKLDVSGLIDPTGLVIDEKADVAATGHTTVADKGLLWVKDDTPNRLYFTDDEGTDKKVIHATDSVTELNDVTDAGSGIIISDAERTKLTGIETGATADQTDAEIRAAVEAATDSNVFTDADHTKLNGIAASAVDVAGAVAAVEGEATLDLTGQVTAAQDLRVDGMVYQQFKDLTTNLATGWHSIALIEGRSGGVASGGTGASEQRGIGTFLIRNTSSSDHQSLMFVASHLFGTSNANGISIEHSSLFANLGISGVRMKEKNTYDGAVLQIEISDATNDIEVFLINNFQESGWELIQAVDDATDPSTVSLGVGYSVDYSAFNTAAVTDVTPVATLGKSVNRLQVDGTTLNVNVASYDNKVGIGTATPATLLHVAGTIRQAVTSAVLVADANGDLAAASNLADQTYLAPGGAEGDTFTVTGTSSASWAGAAPTTIQEAIERIAAYVVTIPGAPPQIP